MSPFQQHGENDTSGYAIGPQPFEYIEMGMGSPGEAEKAMHGRTTSLSTSAVKNTPWVSIVAPRGPIITGDHQGALDRDATASLITAIAFGTCQNKNQLIVTPNQRAE